MKGIIAVGLAGALGLAAHTSAFANSQTESVRADVDAALAALDAADYRDAAEKLNAAAAATTRLQLQKLAADVAATTRTFRPEPTRLTLAASSTLSFEQFLKERRVAEQILKDDKGNVVTIRVFGEDRDLEDFMFIADDEAMLKKAGLERAEMRGEPALKRRGDDGALSVIMMDEKEHALIEIEGASADAVMAVITEFEAE